MNENVTKTEIKPVPQKVISQSQKIFMCLKLQHKHIVAANSNDLPFPNGSCKTKSKRGSIPAIKRSVASSAALPRRDFWSRRMVAQLLSIGKLVVSTNPSEKICSSNWKSSPRVSGWKFKKYLKPPPSWGLTFKVEEYHRQNVKRTVYWEKTQKTLTQNKLCWSLLELWNLNLQRCFECNQVTSSSFGSSSLLSSLKGRPFKPMGMFSWWHQPHSGPGLNSGWVGPFLPSIFSPTSLATRCP